MDLMPWKDQFRLAGRGLRWVFWPADQKTWANIASLVVVVAMAVSVGVQLWLGLLAGFFLWYAVGAAGRC